MAEQYDDARPAVHPIDLFEQLVSEVEAIVQRLEVGDLPLAQAIQEYQRGVELIRRCNELLDRAELQISQLRLNQYEPAVRYPTNFFDDAEDDEKLPV